MAQFSSVLDIRARLSGETQSFYPIQHGSMRVGLYAPKGEDKQTPHEQDELYIINRGEAIFVYGTDCRGQRTCREGDTIFVAAGDEHRFENLSDDFETWVVFYGAQGGENAVANNKNSETAQSS